MRDRTYPVIAILAAGLLGSACTPPAARADQRPSEQDFAQIERGRYLTAVADCAACHSSAGSADQFAGGRAIETPFGKVLAANITPDQKTGIGSWTDSQFDAAVRLGRLPDGSRLYPAMPFPYYTRMTQAEVRAIRAYLNTLPPVHHEVHTNQLPFPFSVRASMWVWDALYFNPGPYKDDPGKSAQWNRGAYLVRGPGHCAACHSPKTSLGAIAASSRCRATPSRAGSLPMSRETPPSAWATGLWMMWSPTLRTATTDWLPLRDRWAKKWPIP